MEDNEPAAPPPVSLSELDLMDEFILSRGWVGSPDCSILLGASSSPTSPFGSSGFFPAIDISNSGSNPVIRNDHTQEEGAERSVLHLNPSQDDTQANVSDGKEAHDLNTERWLIQPMIPVASLKERFAHALNHIKETLTNENVLLQIWVPVKIGERYFLSTVGQPFSLDQNCPNLINYRTVSMNYCFSAEENSSEAAGFPGRVFLGRIPEWTPDVRYFTSYEFPRVDHAQRCNVHSTIAFPIFQANNPSCLGVLEVVSMMQKINYHCDLENICNALQAVDLRSCSVFSVPGEKANFNGHTATLLEIFEIIRAVCETHKLPLAQTWIPCIQHGKKGCRHSEENYKNCISTVDEACYVKDSSIQGFHEACSEYHLFKGQGVVGKAFTTNQPCFSADITAFSKIEYPLSHHAKLFNLQAAVAIRLRSIHSSNVDFVLELFLPIDCREHEEQIMILNSLSITVQQVSRSLRFITAKELHEEIDYSIPSDVFFDKPDSERLQASLIEDEPSWLTSNIKARHKEAGISLFRQESQELRLSRQSHQSKIKLPAEEICCELKQFHNVLGRDNDKKNTSHGFTTLNSDKATGEKHKKPEKTVSLQVLRQYFAGNLKDAAKSIGVSPTTLKRICRQYGIARWPSRKIKKVGHSFRKLKVLIDSVQGAEGTFHLSSLYGNFSKLPSSQNKSSDRGKTSTQSQTDLAECVNAHRPSGSNSASSCSHGSSSSLGCSTSSKHDAHSIPNSIEQEVAVCKGQPDRFKRVQSQPELQISAQGTPELAGRSQSWEHLLKVKAVYGEERVRFRLHANWGFEDLKQEIVRRLHITEANSTQLKYLDDDSEWILLACDDDLRECVAVHRSSANPTRG
ncbi:Protein NLP1 [Apostasia shenzhenica]|uniref:Protein NLP1 n=1 Tax=Apostasia shenzhenica TaxID=1088818 RepID=A0A2I0B006_9ASPA|nr:Protein NLP1 [Apostasia shenzhenica]